MLVFGQRGKHESHTTTLSVCLHRVYTVSEVHVEPCLDAGLWNMYSIQQ